MLLRPFPIFFPSSALWGMIRPEPGPFIKSPRGRLIPPDSAVGRAARSLPCGVLKTERMALRREVRWRAQRSRNPQEVGVVQRHRPAGNGFGHKRNLPCQPCYTWDWRAAVNRPIAARSCSRKPPALPVGSLTLYRSLPCLVRPTGSLPLSIFSTTAPVIHGIPRSDHFVQRPPDPLTRNPSPTRPAPRRICPESVRVTFRPFSLELGRQNAPDVTLADDGGHNAPLLSLEPGNQQAGPISRWSAL